MIIAGAGGHALDLLDILLSDGEIKDLYFFDEINSIAFFQGTYPILHNEIEVENIFQKDPRFILGTGNPQVRFQFYKRFLSLGGQLVTVKGKGTAYSNFSTGNEADIFNLCFIGANTKIGKGCLINTGVQIHHEVEIGDFSEVNPGAVILGKVQVGSFSSIGANATILPNVKIGNNVIIGAGSVIINDLPDDVTAVGIPGRIV